MSQYRRPEAGQALMELLAALDEGKKAFLKEAGPFLYIAFLCTSPGHQGQGLGGQLLAHLLSQADAAGKWVYLEATNERNAKLYERLGFTRRGSKTWTLPSLPGKSSSLIFMSRPPRKA